MPETQETFELLKNYVNELPIGLLLFNKDKKLLSWNNFFIQIVELKETEIKNNCFGIFTNQIIELLNSVEINEKELIGLSKPYKAKKNIANDKNIILVITESFQETIGEMSHELRRPLTNIKTLAESLLLGAKDDPDVAERFLGQINSEIDRLTKLVNDLLNISKIRSGKLTPSKRKINLKLKVDDAIKLVTPAAEKNKITIINEIENGYEIFADPDQIDHVIQNLIENAVKYSPNGSEVRVKPGPIEGSFQVDDTGIGIAPDQLTKIFERFYRVDRTKAKGSSGLGLAIVKNVIDIHSGKIEVKSTIGKGSSFIVYLPSK